MTAPMPHPADDLAPPEARRIAMVASQLRPNAVSDTRVLAAMGRVPREAFLPPEAAALAYLDRAVPLGGGREQNAAMPTGRLLNEAYLRAGDRVLLIGAAGGYTAAVLAEIVASVTAVEVAPMLVATARAALAGVERVRVVEALLPAGAPDGAPYDVLVIDGAVEEIPASLIEQLAPDARVVTGLIERGVRRLAAGRRAGDTIGLLPFADVDCAILPGFAKPRAFTF